MELMNVDGRDYEVTKLEQVEVEDLFGKVSTKEAISLQSGRYSYRLFMEDLEKYGFVGIK